MKIAFDVAIAGAGISGTCAAIALAQQGHKVLLIESGEFPRHKVCGEFLSPESKAVFQRLGVLQMLVDAGAVEVQNARVLASGTQMQTHLPQAALALSRFRLDEILIEAARDAGAKVLCETRVRGVQRNAEHFALETSSGQFRARGALAATGRHSSWLPSNATPNQTRYVGLKTHFRGVKLEAGTVELHAWRGGYCGLVQIEERLTNVCLLARYDTLQNNSPEEFWQNLLKLMPSLRSRMQRAEIVLPWIATGNVVFGRQTPVQSEVMCCGDAAGFIHPLTGDGMAMAARSGELAAATLNAFARHEIDWPTAQSIYAQAWQREFASRLKWATYFQSGLIESAWTMPLLSLMGRVPKLGNFAVRKTRGTL
jgi:flavin-dependent dehydrogenase